jgi:hypothetical protein
VERVDVVSSFKNYDPTSRSGEFDSLIMERILYIIQERALLLQHIRVIMPLKIGRSSSANRSQPLES